MYTALSGLFLASMAHAGTTTRTTNYEYEQATGLMTAQVQEPENAQLNLRTQYTYGQFGNLLTTQVSSSATGLGAIPAHTTNTLQYDVNGVLPTSTTNALGHVVQAAFTPSSLPLSHTDSNGLSTTWQYDSLGRKTQEKKADGTIMRWQYLLCGAGASCTGQARYLVLVSQFAADGSTTNGPWVKTYFDRLDRVVRVETDGFSGVSIVDTEYDGQGRIARVSRPYFANAPIQWAVNSYDVLGRLLSTTSPDNSVISKSYNGLTTTTTNALKQTQTWLIDSQGKVLKVTDAQNNVLSYNYDPLGNLTKTTDPKGNTIVIVYDALGRKTSLSDPNLGTMSFSYDALGRVRQQTDAKSKVTSMTYDLLGRMLTRAEADLVSTWTYDSCFMGKGRMCRASADNGYKIDYTFDSAGRQTQSTTKIDSDYVSAVTYGTDGRVATIVYPTGLTLKHLYSPSGYLKEIRNNATNAMYWQANAVDAQGHLLQQTYGNGVVVQQIFDIATGRTKNIYAGPGNAVQNLSFTYDPRGNMLTRNDANQNLSETFLYDPLNRLTSNTVNSLGAGVSTQTYGYDSIGNITSRSDMGNYTYGAVNARPHAVAEISLAGGGKRLYTYDQSGNVIKEEQRDSAGTVLASKGRSASYTSFDMPTTLANPATTISFVYGPDHQRVKQVSPAATTIYVHPDNNGGLAYEKDIKSDGSIEHKHFITAPDGVVALVTQTTSGTNTLYMHRDQLGSTSAVTDAAGAVVERMAYEPFGKRRAPAGIIDTNNTIVGKLTDRGFTNHEHLDELGLIHMNGRVYDPAIGRFMSADPSVPYPTNIQSYNRYSYVRNNPLVMIDPSGFCDTIGKNPCDEDAFSGDGGGGTQADANQVVGATQTTPEGYGIVIIKASDQNREPELPRNSPSDFGPSALNYSPSDNHISIGGGSGGPSPAERDLGTMAEIASNGLPLPGLKFGKLLGFFRGAENVINACCCFPAGTPVETEFGPVPIEQIRVGQMVYARDPDTGETRLKAVTQVMITQPKALYELVTLDSKGNQERVEVSDNHPYWVLGKGWVDSKDLTTSMTLQNLSNEQLIVVSLRPLGKNEVTYNFTVADFHTYFAGKQKAFVHNCACAVVAKDIVTAARYTQPGWIQKDLFSTLTKMADKHELPKGALDKMTKALKTFTSGEGGQGIKHLGGGKTVGGTKYLYELKILGDSGGYRLYGNMGEEGQVIFEAMRKGH